MSSKVIGRSRAEVMEQLGRNAGIRRLSILQPGLSPRPVEGYVVEAMNLILSAKGVLAAAAAESETQRIPSVVCRGYVRIGDFFGIDPAAARRPVSEVR